MIARRTFLTGLGASLLAARAVPPLPAPQTLTGYIEWAEAQPGDLVFNADLDGPRAWLFTPNRRWMAFGGPPDPLTVQPQSVHNPNLELLYQEPPHGGFNAGLPAEPRASGSSTVNRTLAIAYRK